MSTRPGPGRRPPGTAVRVAVAAAVALLVAAALAVLLRTTGKEPRAAPPQPPPTSTAPSSSPTPAAAPDRSARTRAVRDLLRTRADAVRTRDRAAFMAGIDPDASPEFRQAQRELFANLRGVPLAQWRYRLTPRSVADTGKLPAQPGRPDELWAPDVRLRYALAGVDPRPTSRTMGYLFVRRGERWYLGSDTALDDQGVHTWRGPWDFGPCIAVRTRTGLIIAHPSGKATAQGIAGEIDPAVAAVSAVWGPDWPRRVAVFIPASRPELRALVGPNFAAESIAAVAVADYADARRHVATGQRVVLNPGGAAQLSPPALSVVLRHEITHVAARRYTVDGAPMWMLEGFADYVGYANSGIPLPKAAPGLAALVREDKLPRALPPDRDFRADADQLDLAYQQSLSLCRYIAERFSQPKLVELYHAVAEAGPTSDARLDGTLRSVLGIDRAELVRGWGQYLRTALR